MSDRGSIVASRKKEGKKVLNKYSIPKKVGGKGLRSGKFNKNRASVCENKIVGACRITETNLAYRLHYHRVSSWRYRWTQFCQMKTERAINPNDKTVMRQKVGGREQHFNEKKKNRKHDVKK